MRWIEPSLQGKFKGISVLFWGQRVSKYVDVTRCPIKAPFSKFFYVSSSHPNDALCSSFSSKITGSAEDLIVFRAQVELLRLLQGPRTQIAKNIGFVFFSFHCLNTVSPCHGPHAPNQLLVHPEIEAVHQGPWVQSSTKLFPKVGKAVKSRPYYALCIMCLKICGVTGRLAVKEVSFPLPSNTRTEES